MPSRSFLFFLMVSGASILPSLLQAYPPALSPTGREHFSDVKLRAYGTLSADRKLVPGQPQSSVLLITCESEPKAQLVLAKYLSDLGLLPGVSPLPLTTARGPVSARQVEGQGVVAAARCGRQVYIFTAADGPALQALYESNVAAGAKINATDAEIPVPMYVDRWDKYGFRFYYGPFTKPKDANTHQDVASYDPTQDFTFAKQAGDVGLVVWNTPNGSASADGIMRFNSMQWVYDSALKLKLPLGINLGLEDRNGPLINRYPEDMVPFADQFLGGWYGSLNPGGSAPAWSSAPMQDIALGEMQPLVREFKDKYDNIVNWLEPHEEMGHGDCDLIDDHGPNAKDSFHAFLKAKYGTPAAVAKRWSQPGAFTHWDDIPFPELATFLGWNANAFDLTGIWKINYDAPYGIDSAKTDLDDSSWLNLEAPGNAIIRMLPRKPAVFRRHFTLAPAWRAAHPKIWLYVWDLNDTRNGDTDPKDNVLVFMNGKALPEDPPRHMGEHFGEVEVTPALVDGDNVLTICLPQAIIDYHCYLSGEAPGVYPALGPRLDAEWADFSDWTSWSRGQAVRRGAQMIRQVDPDRPITMMAPGPYLDDLREVAEDYGGVFHDTGGMAGFWTDYHPLMAAGNGLPTDCEPGNGAPTLEGQEGFKCFMGRWSTEATNGVDYFGHIGDVEWNPEIKDYFQKTLPLWHLIGKYHTPQPEVALLDSSRNQRLFGFPWNLTEHASSSPDLILGPGMGSLGGILQGICPRAGLVDNDFARGNADPFRLIVDGNTTIMDPEMVDQITAWVKRGGIFVTYKQTGRHTSTQQDSWPIAKLTGYDVTSVDSMTSGPNRQIHPVDGQPIFDTHVPRWPEVGNSRGLSLKKRDPACQDLLQWDDGSIAAGMRPLGKGMVVDLGMVNPDAIIPQIIKWAKVKDVPGEVTAKDVVFRHFISNNGLDDVWVMWNSQNTPVTTDLLFHDGLKPAFCHDVNTGEAVPIDSGTAGAKLSNLALDSWQTRAFLTPRGQLADAPAEWFKLQRQWWKGTADPGPPIPPYQAKLAVNLSDHWAFKPIEGPVTGTPPEDPSLADPMLDDSSWERRSIGIFDIPDHQDVHHAIFRKTFTVPAAWNHGRVLYSGHFDCFDGARQYIDGRLIPNLPGVDPLGGVLKPGSTHSLAFELWGAGIPVGLSTPVWLSYRPDPVSRQPLAAWSWASDFLTYGPPAPLPETVPTLGSARTVVRIDSAQAQQNVVFHLFHSWGGVQSVIINGNWIPAAEQSFVSTDLNLTPWVKFGRDNEIIVILRGPTKPSDASLDYYEKAAYP